MAVKPILFATDLTARCDRPMDRALMLAQESNVPLIILHVANPKNIENPILVPRNISQQLHDDVPDSNVEITPIVSVGEIAKEIINTAQDHKCQFVVMGVAHFDGIEEVITGTPVDKVVCDGTVPALIVKQRPKMPYRRLVVATDFSRCSHDAMIHANALFPSLPIHLVHVYHVAYEGILRSSANSKYLDQEARDLMSRFVAESDIAKGPLSNLTTSIIVGELEDVFQTPGTVGKNDLVVVGTHGHSGFIRSSMGFNTRRLMKSATQDILISRGLNPI